MLIRRTLNVLRALKNKKLLKNIKRLAEGENRL